MELTYRKETMNKICKLLLPLISLTLVAACGTTPKKTTTAPETASQPTAAEATPSTASQEKPSPEASGAPWELLPTEERETYQSGLACPDATKVVTDMKTWSLLEIPGDPEFINPSEFAPGHYIRFVQNEVGMVGVLQYTYVDDQPLIYYAVLQLDAESAIPMLDFFVAKSILDGENTAEDFDATVLPATGDYFCVWPF